MIRNQTDKKRNRSSTSSTSSNSSLSPFATHLGKKQRTQDLLNSSIEEEIQSDIFNSKMADPILVASLIAALKVPEVQESVAQRVAQLVNAKLEEKIDSLNGIIEEKNTRIVNLENQVEGLEMYGRRNGIRLFGIKEHKDESTDNIVLAVANKINAQIPTIGLGRSHRVGKPTTDGKPRAIIAKFISHNMKVEFLKAFMKMKKDTKDQPNNGTWNEISPGTGDIYANEDLTATRANWAMRGRKLRKESRIENTWSRDGIIFLKYHSGIVKRIDSESELVKVENSLPLASDTEPKTPVVNME